MKNKIKSKLKIEKNAFIACDNMWHFQHLNINSKSAIVIPSLLLSTLRILVKLFNLALPCRLHRYVTEYLKGAIPPSSNFNPRVLWPLELDSCLCTSIYSKSPSCPWVLRNWLRFNSVIFEKAAVGIIYRGCKIFFHP